MKSPRNMVSSTPTSGEVRKKASISAPVRAQEDPADPCRIFPRCPQLDGCFFAAFLIANVVR
jgi:hypothetical protein